MNKSLIDCIKDAVTKQVLADLGLCPDAKPKPAKQDDCVCNTPVVVFTQTRDVWYGLLQSDDGKGHVVLANARHCYYWAAPAGKDKGAGTLATIGPQAGSKVGPVVKKCTILNAGGVVECDVAAVEAWRAASWGA